MLPSHPIEVGTASGAETPAAVPAPRLRLRRVAAAWAAAVAAATATAVVAMAITSVFGFPLGEVGQNELVNVVFMTALSAAVIAAPTVLLLGLPLWFVVLRSAGLRRRGHAIALGLGAVCVVAVLLLPFAGVRILMPFLLPYALLAGAAAGDAAWRVLNPGAKPGRLRVVRPVCAALAGAAIFAVTGALWQAIPLFASATDYNRHYVQLWSAASQLLVHAVTVFLWTAPAILVLGAALGRHLVAELAAAARWRVAALGAWLGSMGLAGLFVYRISGLGGGLAAAAVQGALAALTVHTLLRIPPDRHADLQPWLPKISAAPAEGPGQESDPSFA